MAWDFLRKFLKLVGGKVMSKLAPRLLFFQYCNRPGLQLEEQKKKFRILLYSQSYAEILIYQLIIKKNNEKLGISSILTQNRDNQSQVSSLEVNGYQDIWDDKTVSSHYEGQQQDFQFLQVEGIHGHDI